jgi:predicted ATPase
VDSSLVKAVRLLPPGDGEQRLRYPWDLPVIEALNDGLALNAKVTYLIGERQRQIDAA